MDDELNKLYYSQVMESELSSSEQTIDVHNNLDGCLEFCWVQNTHLQMLPIECSLCNTGKLFEMPKP